MKKYIFFLLIVIILIAGFKGKGFPQSQIEFRLASQYPVGTPMHNLLIEWIKKINDESNGRIRIRIFPAGTLLTPLDLYDGVVKGVADMSAGWRYRAEGYKLGILLPAIMTVSSVKAATLVYEDLWRQFQEIREEWKDVKPLWLTGSVSVNIFTRKEFKRLDDLRGMQIRTPDKAAAAILKDLGVAPVFMSSADLPVALEKGTIDGGYGAITLVSDYKLEGRIKTILMHNFAFTTPNWVIMNLNSYNNLPADLRRVIDNSCDWGKRRQTEVWSIEQERVFDHFKKAGINLLYFSPEERERFYNTLKQTQFKLVSELDKKGIRGSTILQFIQEKAKTYSETR